MHITCERVWNLGFRYKFCIKLCSYAKGNGVACQKLEESYYPFAKSSRYVKRERDLLLFSCLAFAYATAATTFNLINKQTNRHFHMPYYTCMCM